MPPLYALTVMAPEQTVFQGQVRSLVVPGVEGYLGVLAHHAAMVAELGTGRLSVTAEDGAVKVFAVSGGFLETGNNHVTILADSAEAAGDIDVARAEAARDRAHERLTREGEDVDVPRAQAALARALNRLRVAGRS